MPKAMPEARDSATPTAAGPEEILGKLFSRDGREFLRAQVPRGDNRGRPFTIAQPLAGRYRVERFFASGGMGLLLEGIDLQRLSSRDPTLEDAYVQLVGDAS